MQRRITGMIMHNLTFYMLMVICLLCMPRVYSYPVSLLLGEYYIYVYTLQTALYYFGEEKKQFKH